MSSGHIPFGRDPLAIENKADAPGIWRIQIKVSGNTPPHRDGVRRTSARHIFDDNAITPGGAMRNGSYDFPIYFPQSIVTLDTRNH